MNIRWPKPYTKALTRDQIRFVVRIHALDQAARYAVGFKRASRGIYLRIAKEFGVSRSLIEEICTNKRADRRKFRDINHTQERKDAKRIKGNRALFEPASEPPADSSRQLRSDGDRPQRGRK